MKHKLISAMLCMTLATSCVDMDIAPKNIVTSESLLSNESGMDIYMARLYSNMPWEDFKYLSQWGLNFNGWLNSIGIDGTGEAMNRDGICRAFTGEDNAYWGKAFELVRDANYLIENLPKYQALTPRLPTITIWAKLITCVPRSSTPWPVVSVVSLW